MFRRNFRDAMVRHQGQGLQGCPEGRAFFLLRDTHLRIHDVGDHLSPGRAVRASACQHDLVRANPESNQLLDAELQGISGTLHGRSQEIARLGVVAIDPDQTALGTRQVRRAFAVEERERENAAGATRRGSDFLLKY